MEKETARFAIAITLLVLLGGLEVYCIASQSSIDPLQILLTTVTIILGYYFGVEEGA